MRRGFLGSYLDLKKGSSQQQGKENFLIRDKNRRPSRIEERIRLRKLHQMHVNNNRRFKSPDSVIKSCDSFSPETNLSDSTHSCSSSSSENVAKIRDSKQRVDLLEIQASNRPSLNAAIRSKKFKVKSKIYREKINSLFPGRPWNYGKPRPKSAPCTPLFQIKYAKNNRFIGDGKSFVDYKVVEKDCIDGVDQQTRAKEIIDQPIGNPTLISVMKESLDKLKANLKSSKSRQDIDDIEPDTLSKKSSSLNSNVPCDCGDKIIEIEENSTPENGAVPSAREPEPEKEPEVCLKSSENHFQELRLKEHPEIKCEANSSPRTTFGNDDEACEKPLIKCRMYRCRETGMERRRRNTGPCEHFIGLEEHCNIHQPTVPRDLILIEGHREVTENSCRSDLVLHCRGTDCRLCGYVYRNEIESDDFSGLGTPADPEEEARISSGFNIWKRPSTTCCRNCNRLKSGLKECRTVKNCGAENTTPTDFSTEIGASSRSADFSKVGNIPAGNSGNLISRSRGCWVGKNWSKTRSSNFESDEKILPGDYSPATKTAECVPEAENQSLRTILQPSNSKPTDTATRSRNNDNGSCCHGLKYCRRISGQRSKSSPRRVSFCLPSLIPEETSCCSDAEDNKRIDKYYPSCICSCVKCSGIGGVRGLLAIKELGSNSAAEPENRKKFFSTAAGPQVIKNNCGASRPLSNSLQHVCNCSCQWHQSKSPRVNFCREILTKDQGIVRGDFPADISAEVNNSGSQTSVTSAKNWAVDPADENLKSFENISFPKETRRAMNVLLQSRDNAVTLQKRDNPRGSIAGEEYESQLILDFYET